MDEIQYASERDLAIRNVDRESSLLRDVKGALRRIHDGSFGTCIECESMISPRRLAAVPWDLNAAGKTQRRFTNVATTCEKIESQCPFTVSNRCH
jgi:RNA polymerase-binding transcription factor DksA